MIRHYLKVAFRNLLKYKTQNYNFYHRSCGRITMFLHMYVL